MYTAANLPLLNHVTLKLYNGNTGLDCRKGLQEVVRGAAGYVWLSSAGGGIKL